MCRGVRRLAVSAANPNTRTSPVGVRCAHRQPTAEVRVVVLIGRRATRAILRATRDNDNNDAPTSRLPLPRRLAADASDAAARPVRDVRLLRPRRPGQAAGHRRRHADGRGRREDELQGAVAVRDAHLHARAARPFRLARRPRQGLGRRDRHRHLGDGRPGEPRRERHRRRLLLPVPHLGRRLHGADQRPRAVRLSEIPVRVHDAGRRRAADALHARRQGLPAVLARDEAGAASAAGGHRRQRGRAGTSCCAAWRNSSSRRSS